MSGGIDPLLPEDEDDVGRVSATVDVTALYELHRVRLVRLAAAITLDRVIAEEVANEAFVALQKRIGNVEDPIAHLQRTVAHASASSGISGGRGFTGQRRRKIAARRPDRVAPVFTDPALTAMWHALAALDRRQRAVLVLSYRPAPVDPADHAAVQSDRPAPTVEVAEVAEVAEELGWPRRTVASTRHAALARLAAVTSAAAEPLEACLARTLAAAMPQLAEGEDVLVAESHLDPTPTGRNALRLFVPAEPKRHRLAWAAVVVLLVAAMVGTVAFFSHRQGDLVPVSEDTTPGPSGVIPPEWYEMLRPFVPERFDRIALVALDADHIRYVAIETDTGRSLDIDILRRATAATTPPGSASVATAPPASTPASSQSQTSSETSTSIPDGYRFVNEDGTSIEVRCELCRADATVDGTSEGTGAASPLNVQAIAAGIAAGFTIGDVGSSFGIPSELRTDLSVLAATVAAAVPSVTADAIDVALADAAAAPAAAASDGAVQPLTMASVGVEVLVVHGVFPAPAELLRPPMHLGAGGAVGWLVQPDGTATRLIATGAAGASSDGAESLLDALGSAIAIDRAAGTP